MRGGWALLVVVAAGVLGLDQWTKRWASTSLPFQQPVEVLGEYLRLTYTRNSGVAFGLGSGTGFPYYVFSILAAVVILWLFWRRRPPGRLPQLSLALILGGALGNLVDRIATGEVVDFIEIGVRGWHWPVFNVADTAVSVGVVLFALTWPRHGAGARAPAAPAGPDAAPPAAGEDDDGPHARAVGAGDERGSAAGSLPRDRADRPLA